MHISSWGGTLVTGIIDMKYTKLLSATLSVFVAAIFCVSPIALADGPDCSILPKEICNSSTTTSSDTTKSSVFQIVIWVVRILIGAVGIAAVGALIYAGIMYSSASGDSGQVTKAKALITNTVIGLVVYAGMFVILNWLIPGGVLG